MAGVPTRQPGPAPGACTNGVEGGRKACDRTHENGPHTWRPFQLAFFLLCLDGITNPHSTDRDLVDLLWFPTGGGKTEAYLALIAYTVFLRRLGHPSAGPGVA